MGIPAHVRVLAGYDPWVFLEERQSALATGRMDLRTIWIGRQESRVSHQLTHVGPREQEARGPFGLARQ